MTPSAPARDPRGLAWEVPEPIYVARRTGEFVDVNQAFLELVGADDLETVRRLPPERLWVDPAARRAHLAKAGAGTGAVETECDIQRLDGDVRVVIDRCIAVAGPEGEPLLLVGTLQDITTLKARENELRRLAVRDPLTGSYNRRYLAELTPILEAEEDRWGIIILDLDDFGRYNDEHGHQAGDEVLVHTSRFLMQQLRAGDVVIRIGGDEFMALLLGEDTAHTGVVAARLERAAGAGAPAPFTLGWSVREGDEPLAATIGRADEKLVHVKVRERRYPPRRSAPRHSGAASRATVLVVDPDPLIRSAVKRYIEHDGHIVVAVPDRGAALAALEKHEVNLAFVDVGARRRGTEILGQLRANRPSLPLVAMSGTEEPLDEAQTAYGPLYILAKPFAMDRFATILRIVLR